MIQLALNYLGLDPNTREARGLQGRRGDAAQGAPVHPLIRFLRIHQRTCQQGGVRRDVVVERLRAVARARRAAGVNVNLAFTVPKEGANETFSSLLIPVGAPHPEAAYQFINFILRPDVIADISNSIFYGNDNIASRPLVDPRILDDVTLYPTPEIEAGCTNPRR